MPLDPVNGWLSDAYCDLIRSLSTLYSNEYRSIMMIVLDVSDRDNPWRNSPRRVGLQYQGQLS